MPAVTTFLDRPLRAFLDELAERSPTPGGGSAAAVTTAMAAGLVAMVARASRDSWEEAAGIAAQALAIRDRAAPLARMDAEAWQDAVAALRIAGNGSDDGGRRDFELERKLERAAAVPLQIAELGADAAALAALAGELGDGAFRADAAAAAALAAGGASAATHLVEVNLGMREGDERLARARASERAAAEAAERLLQSIR
jgi:formiminotetrahydrofolate cyclodeaminase